MAQAELTIDLGAIVANWRALARLSGSSRTGAVVKADAYGLGAARVATALAAAGVQQFFVALAEEGADLRQTLGPGPEIFVFSGHMDGDAALIDGADLIPLLNSPQQVSRHRNALPGHAFGIQLDTGMNRLGIEETDWQAIAPVVLADRPTLIMSHLACADIPEHPMNAAQLSVFRRMTGDTGVDRSLAATGGILLGSEYHFDLTRPGIGLFGALPFHEALPVLRLSLPVIQIRDVAPGETVGYGDVWTATAPARIATIGAGYADGLIRAMSGRGQVLVGRTPCPMVGRVSMDMLAVDMTNTTENTDFVDLICDIQTVDDVAGMAGTIGYEILTALGNRYRRTYRESLQ